jgi:hypothetical protein
MTRRWIVLVFLAWASLALAAPIDKSDLNGDGIVDHQDLDIVATDYLKQDPSTVVWCDFRESSILNPKYFRRIMSDSIKHYQALLDYINAAYGCDDVNPVGDLSDLNEDGTVDLDDLILFSINYLEQDWETVDWCVFHGAVVSGADLFQLRRRAATIGQFCPREYAEVSHAYRDGWYWARRHADYRSQGWVLVHL